MTAIPSGLEPTSTLGLYQAIWRWHFYAGIFVIPFTLLLAFTGAIYLFKPHLEPRIYRDLYEVPVGAQALPAADHLRSAEAAFPLGKVTHYSPPPGAGRTATVRMEGKELAKTDVFVDPYTGKVIGRQEPEKTLMSRVRKLHGELLLGRLGTTFVELAACWTLVLLVTGVFLWWPRQARFSPWGILLPRLASGGRIFWRDLHAVGGVYVLFLILALLVTGLPWTDVWGDMFKAVQKRTGQSAPPGQFFNPYKSQASGGAAALPVERILTLARELGVPPGMEIEFPKNPAGTYAIHSEVGHHGGAADPADSRIIHIDQYSGTIVKETTWKDFPATAKAVKIGVRLHQGEYFGLPNLILALIAALGVVLLSVTGTIMWWKRRPPGGLGAPRMPANFRTPRIVLGLFIFFGLFFPLVGASLFVIWILEKSVFAGRLRSIG